MKLNASIEQSFKVSYTYKLHFTQDVFDAQNGVLKNVVAGYQKKGAIKCLFVIDDEVARHFPDLSDRIVAYCKAHNTVLQFTNSIVVPGGEECKNKNEYVENVLEAINSNHICRHSFVVAIGGGAVIDMVGYAATIAHRGVRLIRVPTTVLSQNDAAVGVKNSINIFGKKNFLGTFAPPQAIINDSRFLTSLDNRDWIGGISEAIKIALIKDPVFYDFLKEQAVALSQREMEPMNYLIYRCAELHMQHIAEGGDPFESGSSRPLDFGHWAAHKLEHMTNYTVRHGEAVAIGMAIDLTYASLLGFIDKQKLKEILEVMKTIGFDLQLPFQNKEDIQELMGGINEFREHLGGELTITLLSEIGVKKDVHEIDLEVMKKAIEMLNTQSL